MLINETFFYNADQTEAAYALPDETAIKDISCSEIRQYMFDRRLTFLISQFNAL